MNKYNISEITELFDESNLLLEDCRHKTKEQEKWILDFCENSAFFHRIEQLDENQKKYLDEKLKDYEFNFEIPVKMINNILHFNMYISSYLESIISVRNEMIIKNKIKMIFPYLFLLSHYIELVIKNILFQNTDVVISTHDLILMFEKNKSYLHKIGLSNKYYDYCLYQLNNIKKYTSNNDFSMCFRFPIDKKFNNLIISNKILKIKKEEIELLIENHKPLIIILELLVQLSMKYFYDKLINNFLKLEKDVGE